MKYDKFLTIGSVVMLQGGDKRVMITGYLPMPDKPGSEEMYDYIGCIFPEGMMTFDEILVFNHYQIDKVYSLGYHDKEVDDFKKELEDVEREIYAVGVKNFKDSVNGVPKTEETN